MAGMWISLQNVNLSGQPPANRARVYHAAEVGRNTARSRVPVKTGRLRRSLKAEMTSDGARFGSDVSYASYVEKGTRRMRAQPYLEPGKQAALADLEGRPLKSVRRKTNTPRRRRRAA